MTVTLIAPAPYAQFQTRGGNYTANSAGVITAALGDMLDLLNSGCTYPPNAVGQALVLEANTAITTAGAGVLSAAGLVNGLITRTGPTAAYSDATDTAVAIIAALPDSNTGKAWEATVKNTTAFAMTITNGVGVTLSGQTVIPANSSGRFLISYPSAAAITMRGLYIVPLTIAGTIASTALTTNGAGTITAAMVAGQLVSRTTVAAAFTDTFDTGANIIAAMPNWAVGQSFIMRYSNTVNFLATLAGASGSTLSGMTTVAPNSTAEFLVTYASAGAVTIVGLGVMPLSGFKGTQYVQNTSGVTATIAAGAMEGSAFCAYEVSGGTAGAALTTRTATQLLAGIPNPQVGSSWILRVINLNTSSGTITMTAGGGVTVTGTPTVAITITRDYLCTVTNVGTPAVTLQNIGSGVAN
jgi:hypothetical protein